MSRPPNLPDPFGTRAGGVYVEGTPEISLHLEGEEAQPYGLVVSGFTIGEADPMRRALGYVTKGLIYQGDLAWFFGQSGVMKTALVMDLLAHVAMGRPWFGMRTKPGSCVYVGGEGGGLHPRAAALRQQHPGVPEDAITFVPHPVNMLVREEADALAAYIATHHAGGVALVVLDTYARNTAGGEESGSQDTGLAEENVRHLQGQLEERTRMRPAAVWIHHGGKDESRGMRGHSSMFANADAVVEVTRADGDTDTTPLEGRRFQVRLVKVKDGRDGAKHYYRGKVVHLGEDDEGDPVTAPVIEPAQAPAQPAGNRHRLKPGSLGSRLLDGIDTLRRTTGVFYVPEKIVRESGCALELEQKRGGYAADTVIGVERSKLLDFVVSAEAGPDTPDTERTRWRQSAEKALRRLQSSEIVGMHGGWVWKKQ